VADCAEQHVPLDLVWAYLLLLGPPGNVVFGSPLVFVDMHGRSVNIARKLRRTLGPVHERGKIVVAVRHGTAVDERLGAVSECVLHGVGVEVLAAIDAVRLAAAQAVHRDRPGVFYPAALVNLVDHHLDEPPRGDPHEKVRTPNLP